MLKFKEASTSELFLQKKFNGWNSKDDRDKSRDIQYMLGFEKWDSAHDSFLRANVEIIKAFIEKSVKDLFKTRSEKEFEDQGAKLLPNQKKELAKGCEYAMNLNRRYLTAELKKDTPNMQRIEKFVGLIIQNKLVWMYAYK